MLQWDLRDNRVTQLTTLAGNLKIVKILLISFKKSLVNLREELEGRLNKKLSLPNIYRSMGQHALYSADLNLW